MRAQELGVKAVRLPLQEYYPECTHRGVRTLSDSRVVMNINTLVEMIIAFQETHDWRATFERCIPLRKRDVEDETGNGFDYHNIHSAAALEAISEFNINRYQMKHALHILCEKRGLEYAFANEELRYEDHEEGKPFFRFRATVTVDGKVLGEGRGKNQRSAQGKASWHALVALGEITTE